MKTFRVVHTADLHLDADPVKQKKAEISLEQLCEYCSNNTIEALIIAGDIWEKRQSFCENSGVPIAIHYLRRLSTLVKYIFITKGNTAHDEPSSIKLLHLLEKNIYSYEYPVLLAKCKNESVIDILRNPKPDEQDVDYLIALVPYPNKSVLIQDSSIDQTNADFGALFDGLMTAFKVVSSKYNVPKIMGFHGNVQGCRLSTGQTLSSQDIMIAPTSLELAAMDYYALGHIHLYQEIRPNMIYSSSLYNKNFGELDEKGFMIIDFDYSKPSLPNKSYTMTISREVFQAARPMVKVVAEFKDGQFVYDNANIPPNAELWFHYKINENDRKILTKEKIEELKKNLPEDARVDGETIPAERESRSEKIMEANNLTEEVVEYAATINQKVTETMKKKIALIEEMAAGKL